MYQEVDILLVEDNASDAEMTIAALGQRNLTDKLLHVKDGAEALEFLFGLEKHVARSAKRNPKLILLDLKMPKVDGIEVLRRIRAHEQTKHIPVVMLTSSKEEPDIQKCYDLGVNSYVVKPIEFDAFQKAIFEIVWLM